MAEKSKKAGKSKDKPRRADPIQVAIDYGIDVQALADNLQRTVTDRIKRHQIALNTAERLRKARRP